MMAAYQPGSTTATPSFPSEANTTTSQGYGSTGNVVTSQSGIHNTISQDETLGKSAKEERLLQNLGQNTRDGRMQSTESKGHLVLPFSEVQPPSYATGSSAMATMSPPALYATYPAAPQTVQNTALNQGNHAQQDYQKQLMLLEQQNKKRVLIARQEQDSMNGGDPHQNAPAPPMAADYQHADPGNMVGLPSSQTMTPQHQMLLLRQQQEMVMRQQQEMARRQQTELTRRKSRLMAQQDSPGHLLYPPEHQKMLRPQLTPAMIPQQGHPSYSQYVPAMAPLGYSPHAAALSQPSHNGSTWDPQSQHSAAQVGLQAPSDALRGGASPGLRMPHIAVRSPVHVDDGAVERLHGQDSASSNLLSISSKSTRLPQQLMSPREVRGKSFCGPTIEVEICTARPEQALDFSREQALPLAPKTWSECNTEMHSSRSDTSDQSLCDEQGRKDTESEQILSRTPRVADEVDGIPSRSKMQSSLRPPSSHGRSRIPRPVSEPKRRTATLATQRCSSAAASNNREECGKYDAAASSQRANNAFIEHGKEVRNPSGGPPAIQPLLNTAKLSRVRLSGSAAGKRRSNGRPALSESELISDTYRLQLEQLLRANGRKLQIEDTYDSEADGLHVNRHMDAHFGKSISGASSVPLLEPSAAERNLRSLKSSDGRKMRKARLRNNQDGPHTSINIKPINSCSASRHQRAKVNEISAELTIGDYKATCASTTADGHPVGTSQEHFTPSTTEHDSETTNSLEQAENGTAEDLYSYNVYNRQSVNAYNPPPSDQEIFSDTMRPIKTYIHGDAPQDQERTALLEAELAMLRKQIEQLTYTANERYDRPTGPWPVLYRVRNGVQPTATYLQAPTWVLSDNTWQLLGHCQLANEFEWRSRQNSAFVVYLNYHCVHETQDADADTPQVKLQAPKPSSEEVHIISETLRDTLLSMFEDDENLRLYVPEGFYDNWTITAPYLFNYHFPDNLVAVRRALSPDRQCEYDLLVQYFRAQSSDSESEASHLFEQGCFSQKYMQYLLAPGGLLVSDGEHGCSVTKQIGLPCRQQGPQSPQSPQSPQKWYCKGERIGYNGTAFSTATKELLIYSHPPGYTEDDVRSMQELEAYPLRYAETQLNMNLLIRGKFYYDCRSRKYVTGPEQESKDNSEARYMIDVATHRIMHPSITDKLFLRDDVDVTDTSSEEFFLRLPPSIKGFHMQDKKWYELSVDKLRPVVWNDAAFEALVLGDETDTKELIQAVVTSKIEAERSTDLVSGKGVGLILLLHGGPGTGKTLTAESVAEIAQKPLYRVTCGDLGTEPRGVEEYLEQVFTLGRRWGCVVLLDEADVFLEQRSISNLERNALVSVFLRVLEYYDGILLLTSNRVGTFDEAFKSRIQLAIHYEDLNEEQRRKIWQNFIKRLKGLGEDMIITDKNISELATHKLNGRQIRNVITTSRQLAKFKNETLDYRHLKRAIDVSTKFENYLFEVRDQATEAEIARETMIR